MKSNRLFVVALLALGLQGIAHASPFPADAEANYGLAPADTYADKMAREGSGATSWGVSKRQVEPHNPFPFGGGYIDD